MKRFAAEACRRASVLAGSGSSLKVESSAARNVILDSSRDPFALLASACDSGTSLLHDVSSQASSRLEARQLLSACTPYPQKQVLHLHLTQLRRDLLQPASTVRIHTSVSNTGGVTMSQIPQTHTSSPFPSPFPHSPRRTMFIQTQSTPNPASLMFLPGSPVLPGSTAEFASARAAMTSPLAIAIFRIDGVSRVFFGSDFITITKTDDVSWDILKPEIFAAIMDFYSSGKPLLDASATVDPTTGEEDDEIVQQIKELLETRIRPAVQEDGGDIDFHSFDEETGVVTLRMKGACSGCPSSSVTLKSGVENMLMHYIPEVTTVEQLMEDEEEDSGEASH